MRYRIALGCPDDPLFQPWDLEVADTRHPKVLTVQQPHPHAGQNLFGFEKEPQACEVVVRQEGWEEACIGMHPVFTGKEGMYSLRGYVAEKVERIDGHEQGETTPR